MPDEQLDDERPQEERVDQLFREAWALSEAARTSFLSNACQDDDELRRDVLSLLSLADDVTSAQLLGPAASPLPPPETIGPYRILGELSSGGMGVVYRAEQARPQRSVALKVLRRGLATREARERFRYEIALLARLQHPGIAQIYDAGEAQVGDASLPYFAMELVEGTPFVGAPPDEPDALHTALERFIKVCDAVQHAHRRGVIHRDLKASNLLVDSTGQPKVLDFGIARAVEEDADREETEEGRIVGSLTALSPEQIRGDVDTRTDVYALGVVLYQMLSGRLPYEPRSHLVSEILRAIEEDDPVPLGRHGRHLAGDLEVITSTALEKERERRYSSPEALADDVRRHLRHEVIRARATPWWKRLQKFTRRHRGLVAGGVATALALTAGLALAQRFANLRTDAQRDAHDAWTVAELEQDKFLALRDSERIAELTARAEQLWPRHPRQTRALEQWLSDAQVVLAAFDDHRTFISAMRRERGTPVNGTWRFEDGDLQWLHDRYADLAAAFDQLERELVPDVQARHACASGVLEETLTKHAALWDECITEIALSRLYKEQPFDFEYQVGLVPLEPDPQTGLWEFWMPESGARPVRSERTDAWVITPETGIVLVLIPGGRAHLGSQEHNPGGRNYDPHRHYWEIRRRVHLDPFFLSKYELTQAQWRRVMTRNPSAHNGSERGHHPVEHVSWSECVSALARYGLSLPTEAQWEWAARAHSDSPWWCGETPELFGSPVPGNVSDRSAELRDNTPVFWKPFAAFDDGEYLHGPVGRWRANGFGLYGILGNVREWCQDWSDANRALKDRDGDGLRVVNEGGRYKIVKGGSYDRTLVACRSSHREEHDPGSRQPSLGVRPMRAVQPPSDEIR